MENSCQIRFLRDKFLMRRVNDTAFLVFSKEETLILVTCNLNTELLKVNGMMTVDIKPGCTAFINWIYFWVQHVVSVFPEEVLRNLDLTPKLVNSTLDKYESVDIRSLQKHSQELKSIQALVTGIKS